MSDLSLSIAFVGGGLATLNPCGFPLLPAFLSFYAGADDARLPAAHTRIAQGLAAGLLVTVGFLGAFAVVGLPVSLGVTAIAPAVPWLGLGIGAALALVGLAALAGRRIALPLHVTVRLRRTRAGAAMVLFGVGYGVASLGCTLPAFLVLLGASLSTGGVGATLLVFAAYGLGMAVVLTALAVGAALLRGGIARRLRPLVPYTGRISGALLLAAGGYLIYYWVRVRFGPSATLADDPLVGVVTRFTARVQSYAAGEGRIILALAAVVVAAALAATAWQRRRARHRAARPGRLVRQ